MEAHTLLRIRVDMRERNIKFSKNSRTIEQIINTMLRLLSITGRLEFRISTTNKTEDVSL